MDNSAVISGFARIHVHLVSILFEGTGYFLSSIVRLRRGAAVPFLETGNDICAEAKTLKCRYFTYL